MELQIGQWGNSLGVRIPKRMKDALNLGKGTWVKLTLQSGKLVLQPLPTKNNLQTLSQRVDLEAFSKKITEKNTHSPQEDTPQGKELW